VTLCRTHNGWVPFTRQEVEHVFRGEHPNDTFAFDQMRMSGMLYSEDGGKTFRVTDRFVERVFKQ